MIRPAAVTFLLLLPLMLVFMQGPSVTAELALGAFLGFGALFWIREMRELRRLVPFFACIFIDLAVTYYWKDINNDLTAKYTIGLMLYLLPVGFFLRSLTDRGYGSGVLLGVACFSLSVALVGLVVLRTVGVENIVKAAGIGLSRSNIENESFTYLHFFTITNIIIGMSTFAICALGGIVTIAVKVPLRPKIVALLGFAVAFYINLQVLTRGALVSGAIGVCMVAPLIVANMGLKRAIRFAAAGILILALIVVGISIARHDLLNGKFSALLDRLSQAGDDTRLTHWNEAIGIIQRNLFGGGRPFMQTHIWAHNFFLDTGLTAGIPGLISLLCLFGLIFLQMARVIVQGYRTIHPVFLIMMAQFAAVFVLTMTSPPSLPLFGFLLLVAGFFSRSLHTRPDEGYQQTTHII